MQNNPIIDKMEFVYRRTSLQKAVPEPILLMKYSLWRATFPQITYHSDKIRHFWYFSGCTIPGAAILLLNTEHTTCFFHLKTRTMNCGTDHKNPTTPLRNPWGFIDTYP